VLETRTGKNVEAWMRRIARLHPTDETSLRTWLQTEGVTGDGCGAGAKGICLTRDSAPNVRAGSGDDEATRRSILPPRSQTVDA
jgi:hypothetical protein